MRFSDRLGITKVPDVLQTNGMSLTLRNSLWNLLLRTVFKVDIDYHRNVTELLAEYFFRIPVDSLPEYRVQQVLWLRGIFYSDEFVWWKVYNLLEFLSSKCGRREGIGWVLPEVFVAEANSVLESEMSGFRFVNGTLAPITSNAELESIQQAITEAQQRGFNGVRQHLASAVLLLSQKPTPHYRNSIKESISAVESLSKQITGESGGGLDKALSKLDATVHFHGAFKAGLLSLYGYTSDDDGIRHAILNEPTVGFDEAKFMLVACSAFVNFIIMKVSK
jgi:hypothetical protein